MTVYIVNYCGTIYGVFDSLEKAEAFVKDGWLPAHDTQILEKKVS